MVVGKKIVATHTMLCLMLVVCECVSASASCIHVIVNKLRCKNSKRLFRARINDVFEYIRVSVGENVHCPRLSDVCVCAVLRFASLLAVKFGDNDLCADATSMPVAVAESLVLFYVSHNMSPQLI